jgi:hypothetical protein
MDNLTEMKPYQIAKLIYDCWGYADPVSAGHARAALDVIRQSVTEEEWDKALRLAARMQGQQ